MTFRRTRTNVPWSAARMFDLVADVERYPEFVPHCQALRVVSRKDDGGNILMTCEMVVGYSAFREKFRCSVALDPKAHAIDVDYLDGPFRRLKNHWRFQPVEDGSIVDFTIDFEFKNLLLQAAASALFERVFVNMSGAFIDRATAVYACAPSGATASA